MSMAWLPTTNGRREGNKIYNSSLYKDEYNLDGTISGATWDIVSLPKTKYEYKPGVKFSSIITPGEYKLVSSKGLNFDGVDDYIQIENKIIDSNTEFTLCMGFKSVHTTNYQVLYW